MEELAEYEKRRENRLDKFLDYLNPEKNRVLKPKDEKYLDLMRKAYYWRCRFFSPDQVRKMIMKDAEYSYSMACQVFADMEYIFGKTGEVDKDALRRTLLEYYQRAIRIAKTAPKEKAVDKAHLIVQATDKIAKLYGLHDGDGSLSPNELMPSNVQIIIKSAQINNNTVILPPKYNATAED